MGTSSIHGVKFIDVDGDGLRDPGELGLAGITMLLSGSCLSSVRTPVAKSRPI